MGDYDNDGYDDLFVSYFGKNVLYHNNGDGTFSDVSAKAGVAGSGKRWNTGCAFVDYDRDGRLDLFVANYIEMDLATAPVPESGPCLYKGVMVACGPPGLNGGKNILYHNNGDGTFTDVSESAGIFSAMSPTDEPGTRDLFYSLSQETVYYRYMSHMKRIPRKQLQNFVYVDHRHEVAIVGTVPEAFGEEIIAIGRYYLDQKTNRAEVAFVVRDDWQNQGIGGFIMKHLANIAKRNGISGFTAEVMRDNKAMQAVINHSGMKVRSSLNEGVFHFEMDF